MGGAGVWAGGRATAKDWRNAALCHLGEEKPDRGEIAHGGAPYVLQLDATNKLWRLTHPSHRADQLQVRQLLDKILLGRVVEFVTDAPGRMAHSCKIMAKSRSTGGPCATLGWMMNRPTMPMACCMATWVW